jgi:transcriptional regulator with XRE-family HTH domain
MEMNPTLERISNKSRRSHYLANQIRLGLRFQLRALRKEREFTQSDFASLTGTQQTVISRVENHNADRLSIPTLLKFADAFDVGIVIRFEPIDKVVDWYDNLTPEKLSPKSSESIIEEITNQTETINKSRASFKVLTGKNRNPDQPSLFRPKGVPRVSWEVEDYDALQINQTEAESTGVVSAAA